MVTFSSCGNQENLSDIVAQLTNGGSSSTDFLIDQSTGQAKISSPGRMDNALFGGAIAFGDFNNDSLIDAAVGAYAADLTHNATAGTDTGGVYIFYSIQSAVLPRGDADFFLNPQNNFNSQFGRALHADDVNGDGITDLLVGAPTDDLTGTDTGSVYIYYGKSSGLTNSADQTVTQPGTTANSSFGSAIDMADLDGDGNKELIVGAMFDDSTGSNDGSVWILTGQSDNIYDNTAATELTESTASNDDNCGKSVEVADVTGDGILDILMGCWSEDTGGGGRGKIWIFNGTGVQGTWVGTANTPDTGIANPVGANNDLFGSGIVVFDYDNDGNDDLLVGAVGADDGWGDSGAIYIFNNVQSDTTVDQIVGPGFAIESFTAQYGYDFFVADINGDGENDLAVGAPFSNILGRAQGRVSIIYGKSTGAMDFSSEDLNLYYDYHKSPTVARHSFEDLFGSAVCHMDFNKDGLQDLIVGGIHDDSKSTDDGAIYVFYANSDGTVFSSPNVRITSPGAAGTAKEMGKACLGMDVNADGHEDLLVGSWQDDISTTNGGSVYIFYGSSTSTATSPGNTILGPNTTTYFFGSSLAKGDLDNDGFDDLVVGASGDDSAGTDRGAVYVFRSNSTTGSIDIVNSTQFLHSGSANSDNLGMSVLTYDVDGDGDQDLLAGATGDDDTASASGMVYIWRNGTNGANEGTNTLTETTHDTTIVSPLGAANQLFGSALAKGKYSSTTLDDLFIGASDDNIQGADSGVVYQFKGTSTGFDTTATTFFTQDNASLDADELFGYSITLFDWNQNGTADLFIGAPEDDDPGNQAGSVFIEFR